MDLFDIIPENFFSLLSGKNKRLYLSCLLKTFSIYEMGSILGIDKRVVVDELTLHLEENEFSFDKEVEEDEDEDEAKESKRSLAYFVLRRFEQTGWIYIDVTSDFVEMLNFTDNGITIVEALLNISPTSRYELESNEDFTAPSLDFNPNEYNGYIYTIYALLNSPSSDYGLTISEVYKNTKSLIRSLRKLDSRMKDYLESVVNNTDIHDLIEKLMDYKNELYDNGYKQLKTGDNINKYRLSIVTNLETIQNTESYMYQVTESYTMYYKDTNKAYERANKDLDEIIDVFNEIETFINEIDAKNSKYIDSTIGKIKFLLSEDDNVVGKLNNILKYIKYQNKNNHLEKTINMLNDSLIKTRETKSYNMAKSLYVPRGRYDRKPGEVVDLSRFDLTDVSEEFFKTYKNPYNDKSVEEFLNVHMVNNVFKASDAIKYDSSIDDILLTLYALVYGSEHEFSLEKLDKKIEHNKFIMSDFLLKKEK